MHAGADGFRGAVIRDNHAHGDAAGQRFSGHHHVGHIGILGLERAGEETYQITLGGSADEQAAVGQIVGPGFSSENVVEAIETIVDTYMGLRREESETFLDAFRRVGIAPFKEALYERSAGSDI